MKRWTIRSFLIGILVFSVGGCAGGLSGRSSLAVDRSGAKGEGVWEWGEGNGDKPGNGLRFVVGRGGEVSGTFFLLDPNLPVDLERAGRKVALREVRMEGRTIRFLFVISSAQGEMRSREVLVLAGDLVGAVGSEVKGEWRGEEGGKGREILLVRRR